LIPPKVRTDRTNRTDKTVAAAGFGPDEIAVRAEGLAQSGYLRPQIDLFHGPTEPYPPHQLVLADQRSVGLEQNQQEIESPSPHLDWYTVGKQLAPPQQHKEPAEDKRFAVINRPRFMDRRQWTAAARRLPCLASIV
jgi:hypothetical protein